MRPVGSLTAFGPEAVDRYAPIRRVLDFKAGHYGKPDLPLVVAVLVQENFANQYVMKQVLYGEPDSMLSQAERQKVGLDGFFHSRASSTVSVVVAATELAPWTVTRHSPTAWVNPRAASPLEMNLPFAHAYWDYARRLLVETPPVITPDALVGLPADWPGPGRPFAAPDDTMPVS